MRFPHLHFHARNAFLQPLPLDNVSQTAEELDKRTPPDLMTTDAPRPSRTSRPARNGRSTTFEESSTTSLTSRTSSSSTRAPYALRPSTTSDPDHTVHPTNAKGEEMCGDSVCQYNVSDTSTSTLPIVLGIVIPLVFFAVAMLWIWRVRKKRRAIEELNDKHASLDFGLGEVQRQRAQSRARKRPQMSEAPVNKPFRLGRGMSMDMGSPYVLPSELTDSRPSFHSMSRSVHDGEDPYRPVTMVRSQSPHTTPSLYSGRGDSKKDTASLWTQSSGDTGSGMKGSLLRNAQLPSQSNPPAFGHGETPPLPSPPSSEEVSPLEMPVASVNKGFARKPVGNAAVVDTPSTTSSVRRTPPELDLSGPPQLSLPVQTSSAFEFHLPPLVEMPSPSIHVTESLNDPPAPPAKDNHLIPSHQNTRQVSDGQYDDYSTYADVLGIAQKEAPVQYPEQGLGVQMNPDHHRLSAGFRPLPPDDVEEEPEVRANRIRSFYREYFDERAERQFDAGYNAPPTHADYYEDYNQEYLNSGTVMDQSRGRFIIGANAPYAEPITRRAMTPPPRAPPRFRNESAQGMYSPHRMGGPRPRGHSTASEQRFRSRSATRPMAPPRPLNNLPTPHLLKDDSAIFNAADFAPPSSYKDRQAGRPESPLMAQRPYSPSVRAFTPLASSYDDLRAMPSPHLLRKSGTFTGLDFAPPGRFTEGGISDVASIRSGRSGRSNISASHAANIRAGAYRVSRLPKGVVATKDEFSSSLKPTWEQRGPS